MEFNKVSLTALCADICGCVGVEPPRSAEKSGGALTAFCGDRKCDRVVMYNPDAQAEWLVKKYPEIFERLRRSASRRCTPERIRRCTV